MNLLARVRRRLSTSRLLWIGAILGVIALVVMVRAVDGAAFAEAMRQAANRPGGVALALGAFTVAFLLRAVAWRQVLPNLSFGQSLAGIHVALGANHVLPFRMGEPLRVISAVRRTSIGFEAAAASTVTLRALDLVAVVAVGLAAAPAVYLGVVGWGIVAAGVVFGSVAVAGWWWLRSVAARLPDVRMPGLVAVGASGIAWLAEAVLVWQVAGWAGLDLTASEALVVTTVSVAAQVIAVAPGGLGTYEAAGVAAYVALGYDPELALVAALGAHALKTVYSIIVGLIGVFVPAPSLVGRLRLGRPSGRVSPEPIAADGPVVLFMPAYNEEAAVASCIRRAPETVAGRSVEVLVVDDGSADDTVARAREAGADVIELGINQGLGAAVRVGLAEGVRRRAAAVVFCDADGEYPPEELENMVEPILAGEADYVTGSRFLGHIEHMRPHRRIGNLVLTRALSIVARRRISDGQTGYRALSLEAAGSAEIIHDFNYAQVITLDLLAKGYRHVEVPISYHFRTTGDSFIKLGPYLRKVVPAVYREINAAS
ncbi:MAG: lysylphosphatidylglycerol synthase domain-containing protein [Actinomycetota bacterium]